MRRTKKRTEVSHPLLALVGWVGILCVLLGYGLTSFQILSNSDPIYFVLNLIGAITLGIEAYLHKDTPPILLNIIWAAIAVVGLVRFFIGW